MKKYIFIMLSLIIFSNFINAETPDIYIDAPSSNLNQSPYNISTNHLDSKSATFTQNITVQDTGFFSKIGSFLNRVTNGWFTNLDSININSSQINTSNIYSSDWSNVSGSQIQNQLSWVNLTQISGLWCALTGCTMSGDIDMDGNNINNVGNLNVTSNTTLGSNINNTHNITGKTHFIIGNSSFDDVFVIVNDAGLEFLRVQGSRPDFEIFAAASTSGSGNIGLGRVAITGTKVAIRSDTTVDPQSIALFQDSANNDKLNILSNRIIAAIQFQMWSSVIGNTLKNGVSDFQYHGDTIDNLFFIDTSFNTIGIGTQYPVKLLDIKGTADERVSIGSTGTTAGQYTGYELDAGSTFKGGMFIQNSDKDNVLFWSSSSYGMKLNNSHLDINRNVTISNGFTGSCVNVTYSGGIAISCND